MLRAYLLTLIAALFLEEGEILSDVAHVIELFKNGIQLSNDIKFII